MPTLGFFLHRAVMPFRRSFPDDCEVLVGRGPHTGVFTVTGSHTRFAVRTALATLSEDHTRIVMEGGRVTVEDLQSRNGTLVRLEPGTVVPMGDEAVWLGPDLAVRLEGGRWTLPQGLETFTPEALCGYLRRHLEGSARVTLGGPGGQAWPLVGDARHVVLQPAEDQATASVEDAAWVRFVVGGWNAARDARALELPWGFVAVSNPRRRALEVARRGAPTNLPVLLLGPTGVGKEVLAQDIHDHSARGGGPFVAVNCAGLSAERLESDLFGHVRGAYTGAHADRVGLVEMATGGTLFLDEVGEMPMEVQVKLLRFLESASGEYRRMGESRGRHARVRVVAATNRVLPEGPGEVFRPDLYFRLAGIRIDLPAPAPEDITAIARVLLTDAAHRAGVALDLDDLTHLASLAGTRPWPGGARELRQCVERCVQTRDPLHTWEHDWVEASAVPFRDSSVIVPPVLPPVAPAELGKLVSDAVFLAAARETRSRATLARQLRMTYQGADRRLIALGVDIGNPAAIDHRLHQCMAELHAAVAESPGLQALLLRALGR